MQGYKDRHYGLTGQTVKVKLKKGNSDAYPWEGMEVPVRITAEYPTYLCGTVLPHRNPKGLGSSREYPVTISKHDIFTGEMIVNGGAIV